MSKSNIFELLHLRTDSKIETEIISSLYDTLKKDDKLFIESKKEPKHEWYAQVVSFDKDEQKLRFNVISYDHKWEKFVPETEPKIGELKLNGNYIIKKIKPKGHIISEIFKFGGDTIKRKSIKRKSIKRKSIKRKSIKPRNPNSLGGPTYKY
jgi:hypothetical protein